jgi:hypothetical protein
MMPRGACGEQVLHARCEYFITRASAELNDVPCTRLTSLLKHHKTLVRIIAQQHHVLVVSTLRVKVFILMDAGDQRLSLEGNFIK